MVPHSCVRASLLWLGLGEAPGCVPVPAEQRRLGMAWPAPRLGGESRFSAV